jgi:hypothetical protein
MDPLIFREFVGELYNKYQQREDADEPLIR